MKSAAAGFALQPAAVAPHPQRVLEVVRRHLLRNALLPTIARGIFRLPLLAWTVRSVDDRRKAARYADQMIFEGFRP